MDANRVIAVRVGPPETAEHHITHFKMESRAEMTQYEMIVYVQATPKTYYTYAGEKKTYLEIGRTVERVPYVRTHSDSTPDNNLLNLPRF
ncbi:DUF3892 domain-containing protein [Paenibacillus xylanexedens]|uniref:DUF3892 domain-containing protein n=1 Tax=Paenibacillus xylanexedens TaxID=528191 RepID=UPI0028E9E4E9|nr:DUF3892 domain-containing protein [Paenibacillus xylanexedens]